ncbi:MAG: glycosyltransferase [Shimia sp.]|uniref:glycosyltransferase n=1 Tax=Shimia sp. TaxID=1954381 RepID=UPI0040588D7F
MMRMVFFVPTDKPVGGIAKVLDYAVHAARQNLEVVFCCNDFHHENLSSALFKKPYFQQYGSTIRICDSATLDPKDTDILFFTLPSSHERLSTLYAAAGCRNMQYIHLLQNVRLSNTAFDNGYSYRLLPKPLHRICITQEVVNSVAPFVDHPDDMELIPHGFDFEAFNCAPQQDDPIMINFNTFKGDLGREIVRPFNRDPRVKKVRVSSTGISWRNLQNNYKKSSLFLGTPLPEEGLYLPGLEAMAAGQLVITPDAFGNRFYCDFSENCALVPWGDVDAYREHIEWAIENWTGAAFEMRKKAHAKAAVLGLETECLRFADSLMARYADRGMALEYA